MIAENDQTRGRPARPATRRLVRGCVVDDDELEVARRSARGRSRSPRAGSERRHATPGARRRAARTVSVRPWTTRGFLTSTSSSPPWTASRSWSGCSSRWSAKRHRAFRVLVVDQNDDDRLEPVLERPWTYEVTRLRSAERGLSRARNAALGLLGAELVAFPDDDCVFPARSPRAGRTALQRSSPSSTALTGRAVDEHGSSSSIVGDATPPLLTRENLWNRAISFTIFLRARARRSRRRLRRGPRSRGRRSVVLGRGDRLPRARARHGSAHRVRPVARGVAPTRRSSRLRRLQTVGARDGASIGYILRKHRYRLPTVARMFARPLGGAVVSLLRRDPLANALSPLDAARPAARVPLVTQQSLDRCAASRAGSAGASRCDRCACSFPTPCGGRSSGSGSARFARSATTARRCANCSRSTSDAYAGVDLGAIDYDGGVHAKHRLTRYHDFFVDRIRQGERVLDVGCGKGELAYDIAERAGAIVVAIDASPWMLRVRARALCASARDVRAGRCGRVTSRRARATSPCFRTSSSTSSRASSCCARSENAPARSRLLIRVPALDRDWTVPLAPRGRAAALLRSRAQGRVRPAAPSGRARGRAAGRWASRARLGRDLGRGAQPASWAKSSCVALEPGLEREALDGALARRGGE